MKIKIGEKVYLQKYEIVKMRERPEIIAECVLDECARKYGSIFTVPQDLNVYRFDYCFEEPECVEWLMAQDYIVDYDKYIDMDTTMLKIKLKQCNDNQATIIEEYTDRDKEYREAHPNEMRNQLYCNKWKGSSIGELIALKNGAIPTFGYPEGYTGRKIDLYFKEPEEIKPKHNLFTWFRELFSA